MRGLARKNKNGAVRMYYNCLTRTQATLRRLRNCDNLYFRADQVEPAVWSWLERFIFNEDELLQGMRDYQAAQTHNPLENELKLVKAELAKKEAEFKAAMADMRAATSRRARTILAQDIERIEQQLDALEMRQAEIEAELGDKMLTDEQIMGLMEFAAILRKDWDVISQDYDSRRELLARLNIEVKLFVEDGIKKAKISGKITAEEQTVSLENTAINVGLATRGAICFGG